MKYALENGTRVEAVKGVKAVCPVCGAEMVAKCGEFRIDHWAHKSTRICDCWWEPETEWHRKWKNYYPAEWQECPMLNKSTGELHIADIRTQYDLTIEFQHSAIKPEERRIREGFYKDIVWVVDGTRLKYDFTRFHKAIYNFHHTEDPHLVYTDIDDGNLSGSWVGSSVPVIFDFSAHGTIEDVEDYRKMLYCLLPQKVGEGRNVKILKLTPQEFVEKTTSGEWATFIQKYSDAPNRYQLLRQAYAVQSANSFPIKRAPRWSENFKYIMAVIGIIYFLVSIIKHNTRRRMLKKAYICNHRATIFSRNRQYKRK